MLALFLVFVAKLRWGTRAALRFEGLGDLLPNRPFRKTNLDRDIVHGASSRDPQSAHASIACVVFARDHQTFAASELACLWRSLTGA